MGKSHYGGYLFYKKKERKLKANAQNDKIKYRYRHKYQERKRNLERGKIGISKNYVSQE